MWRWNDPQSASRKAIRAARGVGTRTTPSQDEVPVGVCFGSPVAIPLTPATVARDGTWSAALPSLPASRVSRRPAGPERRYGKPGDGRDRVLVGAPAGILPGTDLGRNFLVGFGSVCPGSYRRTSSLSTIVRPSRDPCRRSLDRALARASRWQHNGNQVRPAQRRGLKAGSPHSGYGRVSRSRAQQCKGSGGRVVKSRHKCLTDNDIPPFMPATVVLVLSGFEAG